MSRFLKDFPGGCDKGRYVECALPALTFGADSFDLALCSYFLFTYSSQLSEEFHLASIPGDVPGCERGARFPPAYQLGASRCRR